MDIGTIGPARLGFVLPRVGFGIICNKAVFIRVTFSDNNIFVSNVFDTVLQVFVRSLGGSWESDNNWGVFCSTGLMVMGSLGL